MQVGAGAHARPRDAPHVVDLRRADLAADPEVAFDGLLGADGPFVVLVERQRDVERGPQVEGAGQRLGARGLVGDAGRRDRHPFDVGPFVERQRHAPSDGVDLPDGESRPLKAEDLDRHDRVGDVVLDA